MVTLVTTAGRFTRSRTAVTGCSGGAPFAPTVGDRVTAWAQEAAPPMVRGRAAAAGVGRRQASAKRGWPTLVMAGGEVT